jgi:hypothetical protein
LFRSLTSVIMRLIPFSDLSGGLCIAAGGHTAPEPGA